MLLAILLFLSPAAQAAAPLKESGFLPRAMTCRDPRTGERVRVTPSVQTSAYRGYYHRRQSLEMYGESYQSLYDTIPTLNWALPAMFDGSSTQLMYRYFPGLDWRKKFDYDPGTLSAQIVFYTKDYFQALTLDHCR